MLKDIDLLQIKPLKNIIIINVLEQLISYFSVERTETHYNIFSLTDPQDLTVNKLLKFV